MFFCYKSNSKHVDPMLEVSPAVETLLKRSPFLRYDRSHAAASAGDQGQQSAIEPTATGEADMEVTGPGAAGSGDPVRPTEFRPTNNVTSAAPDQEPPTGGVCHPDAACNSEPISDDSQVRAARLARIQAEIAAGTYETEEKLETAVERLLRRNR